MKINILSLSNIDGQVVVFVCEIFKALRFWREEGHMGGGIKTASNVQLVGLNWGYQRFLSGKSRG